jgi:colicin import membrane protein
VTNEKSLPSSQREFERGFGWTLLLSGVAHVLVIIALVVAPEFALRPQPQMKSYSVDLVDPSKLGGTNLVSGSKGKVPDPPKVEPAKAKAPEPPPPEPEKAEPPPPEPPPEAKAPEPPAAPPKPEVKPPEPPQPDEKAIALEKKSEPTPTRPQEVAKVEVPTEPPPPPTAKVEPTVAKVEPTKPKPTVAKPQVTATPAKAAAKPQATATKGQPQAVAKAQTTPGAKPNTTPARATTPGKATTPAKPTTPGKGATPADAKGQGEAQARDDRIAAAIKRVQQQEGTRGGGSGGGSGPGTGGPTSIGPGEGTGGEVRSLATIMYTNRIQAMIKDKWAWAGAKTLKADIGFNILPTGEVANVRTVASSGDAHYDRLAETAVRAASPFPAPPAECAEEFETAGFLYTFEPE